MSQPRNDLPGLGVRRPLLTWVLNLLIAIAGAAALMGVEVRELPNIDRPIVSVRAQYPGASPETIDAEVTSIIEGAVARVTGVRSIASSSEENSGRVRVEFNAGVDLDLAAADVREAVSRVQAQLPDRVEQLTVIKADQDAEPVVRLAAWSDRLDEETLTRRLERDIIPELIAIDGVADVVLYGNRPRQLRVQLDPLRLASHGLTVSDVAAVLRLAPFDVPSGNYLSQDQALIVRAEAAAITPAAVEAIVIRDEIRVGDVAEVSFGPADATSYVRLDGRAVIGLGVVRQAQSNTIAISEGVQAVLARLQARFPEVQLQITADDARFIRSSVREVLVSLGLATLIVIATIWLFLGSWRATLVPTVAIPLSLMGTLAAIWALGYSINLVTLLALVLATGLIVDDAIVVLENIQRLRARGYGPRAAALLGTRQVFFAVVATTAVLIAVFVPISFLPGTAGRVFREFGFVLAIAVVISSFVALSLVPSLAARLLPGEPAPGAGVRRLHGSGRFLAQRYAHAVRQALDHRRWMAAGALLFAAGAVLLFLQLPRELVPQEDRGQLFIMGTGPDGVQLNYMERQTDRIEALLQPYVERGEIASLFTIVGRWDPNRTSITAPLAPWEARERSQQALVSELRGPLSAIPGITASAFGRSSLGMGGMRGGVQLALTGTDYDQIYPAAQAFAERIETELPQLSNPELSYQPTQPQLAVDIDRRRASDLGVSLEDVSLTLRAMVAGDELVDLNIEDEAVPLMLQSRPGAIRNPEDLQDLMVRAGNEQLVPLGSFTRVREEGVAAELDRHAQRRAIEIDADLAPGYPLQAAVDDLRALAARALPEHIDLIFLGEAELLEETSREVTITYVIALVVVLLVLVAQFESIASAVVVMAVVPFGLAAAIYALQLSGISLNIYSQIGLMMLIGLMAKNGILLVEFADQLRGEGRSVREAVLEAAQVRLRPIAMTLISTVAGALPLVLASGAGAEARHAIGWVIFGGLGLATAFTLFLTPVIYLALGSLTRPRTAEAERLQGELQAAREEDA